MRSRLKILWRIIRSYLKQKQLLRIKKIYDRKTEENFIPSDIKKVALFRWDDKLGDTIVSGIFIAELQKYRPDIEITVISGPLTPKWFEFIPELKWIICTEKTTDTAKSLKRYQGTFDLVVTLTSHLDYKSFIALSVLHAQHYLGYNQKKYQLFDLNINQEVIHMSARHLEASFFLSKHQNNSALENRSKIHIPYPTFDQQYLLLKNWLSVYSEKYQNAIAVNLFGSSKRRQFSFDSAIELLKHWRLDCPHDLLILIPAPEKLAFLTRLVTTLNDPLVQLSPLPVGLPESLALIDICDFTFTPDTSIVHMASALNKPVLAIYRTDLHNYQEWSPLSNNSQVIFNPELDTDSNPTSIEHFLWSDLLDARRAILEN